MKEDICFTYRFAARFFFTLMLLFTSLMALSSCAKPPEDRHNSNGEHGNIGMKTPPEKTFYRKDIKPILTSSEEFFKVSGWLDEATILYIAKVNDTSTLYAHKLDIGVKKEIFKSELPIITVEINPAKELLLIHSGNDENGVLTIIDDSGKMIYTTNIQAFELHFEWNPFKEDLVLVSTFTEEWDFKTFLLNSGKKTFEEVQLPEPFARWISKNELVYQDWQSEELSLQAPLMGFSVKSQATREILPSVYQFDSLNEQLLTVHMDEADPKIAHYRIFDQEITPKAHLQVPALTAYSGWLIPFYDVSSAGDNLIYLRPIRHGEADIYQDGFDLIEFNLAAEEETVITSGLANEPLSCSPTGTACLFGFRFEKLILLKTKEIISLIQ